MQAPPSTEIRLTAYGYDAAVARQTKIFSLDRSSELDIDRNNLREEARDRFPRCWPQSRNA